MRKREALAWSVLILLFFTGFYLFGRYEMSEDDPPFLIPKIEELLGDQRLMDSIGGYHRTELEFNQIEFHSKDTLRTSMKIIGKKRTLQYNAVHRRAARGENNWVLINDDMVIQ